MNANDTILETERLVLRYQREEDIAFLVGLWTDERAMRFMGGKRDEAFLREEFGRVARNPREERYDLWPAILKESGTPVGYAGFIPKEIEGIERIELVYLTHPDHWGRGYATELARALAAYAKEQLGIASLAALIEAENLPSRRVAERAGLRLLKTVLRPDGAEKLLYLTP